MPEELLNTATLVDEHTQQTEATQTTNYASSLTGDFQDTNLLETVNNVESVSGIFKSTGVIDISDPMVEDLRNEVISNTYAVFRGGKLQSEFPSPDHIMDMYPSIFTYGRGGPGNQNRSRSISLERWVKHLLQLKKRKCATHNSFLFTVFSI